MITLDEGGRASRVHASPADEDVLHVAQRRGPNFSHRQTGSPYLRTSFVDLRLRQHKQDICARVYPALQCWPMRIDSLRNRTRHPTPSNQRVRIAVES
jgi:hypothetical protein